MKYSLTLVALAASALAAPTFVSRSPQRGHHGDQSQVDRAGTAPANTPTIAGQVPARSTAAQVATSPISSQAVANPAVTAPSSTSSAVPTGGEGSIPENLVPDFGVTPGIPNPAQAGSCLGLNDASIPCFCPPPRNDFIARLNTIVAAGNAFGHPAQFPTDDSAASKAARLNALTVTMQNFNGTASGVGCPKAAANFG